MVDHNAIGQSDISEIEPPKQRPNSLFMHVFQIYYYTDEMKASVAYGFGDSCLDGGLGLLGTGGTAIDESEFEAELEYSVLLTLCTRLRECVGRGVRGKLLEVNVEYGRGGECCRDTRF